MCVAFPCALAVEMCLLIKKYTNEGSFFDQVVLHNVNASSFFCISEPWPEWFLCAR